MTTFFRSSSGTFVGIQGAGPATSTCGDGKNNFTAETHEHKLTRLYERGTGVRLATNSCGSCFIWKQMKVGRSSCAFCLREEELPSACRRIEPVFPCQQALPGHPGPKNITKRAGRSDAAGGKYCPIRCLRSSASAPVGIGASATPHSCWTPPGTRNEPYATAVATKKQRLRCWEGHRSSRTQNVHIGVPSGPESDLPSDSESDSETPACSPGRLIRKSDINASWSCCSCLLLSSSRRNSQNAARHLALPSPLQKPRSLSLRALHLY